MARSHPKDYFSNQATKYAAFRPTYPEELYSFIFQHLNSLERAWDCATGNGQVASYLARHFENVAATDISQQQLDQATPAPNIEYQLCPAEATPFPPESFDLVTVGQALHWFDRDNFYEEVRRVMKKDGLLAVWGYALLHIEPVIDAILDEFYNETVGPYWDGARRLVEQEYKTITFPFPELRTRDFEIHVQWTLEQLSGYLESWSATQKYTETTGIDPVSPLKDRLQVHWKPGISKSVRFPVFLRLFRL